MDRALFSGVVALIAGVSVYLLYQQAATVAAQTGESDYTALDAATTLVDEMTNGIANAVAPTPASQMDISAQGELFIRSRERCSLTKYRLGDGGETIGWGHYGAYGTLPASITQAQADAMFADDVQSRAAKWVRLYVTVDVTQEQFDALCSIAYNMSPRSFKKFADSVNAGNGIDGIANQSVSWVPANLQNGIQNRRNAEMMLFDSGVYA
ncbi:glycoside hydrolase family 24 [Paraburkholderia dipogonis]|uniref:Lysozyme n=1 Tax=Paraburkholderia dipogonis TaxID=1211383 RepID=A0A4Y8MVQ1_9BURK|nr:lysozyme [Paraburkholderia dipogonis]TFE41519.1 glycoside hydrolase family 24 [Paraburkholderia dipogonis]